MSQAHERFADSRIGVDRQRAWLANGNFGNAVAVKVAEALDLNTEIFAEHGEVSKVFVPKNRDTGKPKGIAFVTMSSEEERDAAIAALNESEVDERTIYVDKAKPRGEAGKENAGVLLLLFSDCATSSNLK